MSDASWTAGDRVEKRRERREARAQCADALETFYADKAAEQAEREAAIAEANDIFEEIERERHEERRRQQQAEMERRYLHEGVEDDLDFEDDWIGYTPLGIYESNGYESMQDEFDSSGHLR